MGDPAVKVSASETVKENFSIIEKIPDLLKDSGIEHVFLISAEDLVQHNLELAEEVRMARWYANDKITAYQYNLFVAENPTQAPQVFRDFLEKNHPDLLSQLDDNSIAGHAVSIISGQAFSVALDGDIGDSKNTAVMISTPYSDATKAEIVYSMTYADQEHMSALPGLDQDWRNFVIAHEVGHSAQAPTSGGLREEIFADSFANRVFLKDAFNEKSGDFFKMPEAFQAVRAISSFGSIVMHSHITNAAIRTGDEGFAPKASVKEFSEGLQGAVDTWSLEIGGEINSIGKYIDSLTLIAVGEEPLEGYGVVEVKSSDCNVISKMIAESHKIYDWEDENGQQHKGLYNDLSEDLQGHFSNIVAHIDMRTGLLVGSANAPLLYDTTRQLYLDGGFDDNPIGKQYAYEFLVAGETYFPDYFDVEKDADVELVPPKFDKNGDFVEPVKPDLKDQSQLSSPTAFGLAS